HHQAARPAEVDLLLPVRDPRRLQPLRGRLDAIPSIMLELRPSCECCDRDLPPNSPDARICSFECTFCAECAEDKLSGRCPNCGGELVSRPRRPSSKLATSPPSTKRTHKPQGCAPLLP